MTEHFARYMLALAVLTRPAVLVAQQPSDARCRPTWSAPRTLRTRDGHPLYSDTPTAVPVRGGFVFINKSTFEWTAIDRSAANL